jgi:hypothetical protein
MISRRFIVFCTVCLFISGSRSVRAAPQPPGFDRAITTERLTGATLSEIGRNSEIVWHFGVKRFRVEFHSDPPATFVRQLLGQERKVKTIEGRWRYEDRDSRLVLEDLSAGEFHNRQQVILSIDPAGPLRADIGDRQYNIDEFDVRGQWKSIKGEVTVSWKFKFEPVIGHGNPLIVQCENGLLPEPLVNSLMGRSLKVSKIEGKWEFDRYKKQILFKNLEAGGHKQQEVIKATVTPADVLTMELLGVRYQRMSAE